MNNQVGFISQIIPGDGLLQAVLSYNLDLMLFEDSDVSSANRLAHTIGGRVDYKFLPRSTLWIASTFEMFSYLGSLDAGGTAVGRDWMPLKIYGGVSTPLWINLGLTVGGGYSFSWGDVAAPSSWLATASLTYTLASQLKVGVNYSHNFTDSLISAYETSDSFNFFAYVPFGQKMLLQGQVGVKLVNYMGVYYRDAADAANRSDLIAFARAQFSYKFSKSLIGSISYSFMGDYTDWMRTGIPYGSGTVSNDPSFMKHEIYFMMQYYF